METELKESMSYESRMQVVAELTEKMSTMFQPHVRLREPEAGAMYLSEIATAINSRLPSEIPNHDVYREACREIWSGVVAKHRSSYWFSLSDVISVSNKVANKYYGRYGKKKQTTYKGQYDDEPVRVKGAGWSVEGATKALEETRRMMDSGELSVGIGRVLERIPIKALSRLGVEVEQEAPKREPVPEEHLPPKAEVAKPRMDMTSSELNIRLIRAGHTAPKLEDSGEFTDDELPDFGSL